MTLQEQYDAGARVFVLGDGEIVFRVTVENAKTGEKVATCLVPETQSVTITAAKNAPAARERSGAGHEERNLMSDASVAPTRPCDEGFRCTAPNCACGDKREIALALHELKQSGAVNPYAPMEPKR